MFCTVCIDLGCVEFLIGLEVLHLYGYSCLQSLYHESFVVYEINHSETPI
jgi:hypothetical protein